MLISYNVHEGDPQIHSRTKEKGMWVVRMLVENPNESIEIEMRNDLPVDLMLLHPLVMEHFMEAFRELSPITEGSYHIYQRRI